MKTASKLLKTLRKEFLEVHCITKTMASIYRVEQKTYNIVRVCL